MRRLQRRDKGIWSIFRIDPLARAGYSAPRSAQRARDVVGDRPQGVAGDCNSLAETHAWFDSRVAHHFPF